MWTIKDFFAYDNFFGCSVKGYYACLVWGEEKVGIFHLKQGKNVVYMGHRRFIPLRHPYRRCKKAFNGKKKFVVEKKQLTGLETFEKLSRMKFKPLE